MIVSEKPRIELLNVDCMEYMATVPDKYFDLAVVDVPYGISVDEWMAKDSNTQRGKSATKRGEYDAKQWDKVAPNNQYFDELIRVSKNQIIWGANHFISRMPFDSSCWLVWDKENGENGYADCELAWTSFSKAVRMVKYKWHGMLQKDMKNKEERIHPTQKPVALYRWILHNYAKEGDKIIDTHGGSMSSAIACHQMGFDLTLCELDRDYYDAGVKRFKEQTMQQSLFKP